VVQLRLVAQKRKKPYLEYLEQEGRTFSVIQELQDVNKEEECRRVPLGLGSYLFHQFEDHRARGHAVELADDRPGLENDVAGLYPEELLVLPFMDMEPAMRESLEARAEAAEGLPCVPGNALELAPFQGKEGDELVRLAQVHAADDDRFGASSRRAQ
jgi:hypothetical protein